MLGDQKAEEVNIKYLLQALLMKNHPDVGDKLKVDINEDGEKVKITASEDMITTLGEIFSPGSSPDQVKNYFSYILRQSDNKSRLSKDTISPIIKVNNIPSNDNKKGLWLLEQLFGVSKVQLLRVLLDNTTKWSDKKGLLTIESNMGADAMDIIRALLITGNPKTSTVSFKTILERAPYSKLAKALSGTQSERTPLKYNDNDSKVKNGQKEFCPFEGCANRILSYHESSKKCYFNYGALLNLLQVPTITKLSDTSCSINLADLPNFLRLICNLVAVPFISKKVADSKLIVLGDPPAPLSVLHAYLVIDNTQSMNSLLRSHKAHLETVVEQFTQQATKNQLSFKLTIVFFGGEEGITQTEDFSFNDGDNVEEYICNVKKQISKLDATGSCTPIVTTFKQLTTKIIQNVERNGALPQYTTVAFSTDGNETEVADGAEIVRKCVDTLYAKYDSSTPMIAAFKLGHDPLKKQTQALFAAMVSHGGDSFNLSKNSNELNPQVADWLRMLTCRTKLFQTVISNQGKSVMHYVRAPDGRLGVADTPELNQASSLRINGESWVVERTPSSPKPAVTARGIFSSQVSTPKGRPQKNQNQDQELLVSSFNVGPKV